jgi:imidazolonepropionase-like amidohydrolase
VIRRSGSVVAFCLAIAFTASAGLSSAETIAIVGGKVFPVSGPPIENGTVVIVDGTITAVGANLAVPPGAKQIDAQGKWVTPGLIHSATALGIVEVDAVDDSDDTRAKGERGVAAAVRVWDSLNPDSTLWAPAREDGVTNAVVLPGGGFVGGQAALVETLEGPRSEMVRKAPAGMFVDLTDRGSAEVRSRSELLLRFRELLEDARAYGLRRPAFEANQIRPLAANRLHLAALQPVLKGTLPVIVHVDRAADIQALLPLAHEYGLRVILLGGVEAWKVASDLAAAHVPVLTGGLTDLPNGFDQLGATLENAALLRKAGVSVALTTGGDNNFRVRGVRQHAGNAVANGLDWNEALRAVTLTPAEIFGVADKIGSLQAGREANVVVWDGDPFELSTRAVQVFVRGQQAAKPSREQLLVERYKRPQ